MQIPKSLWLAAGGVAGFFASEAVMDKRTRLIIRAGSILAAGFGVVLGFDDITEFLGISARPKVSEVTVEGISNINTGAEGSTGILAGHFIDPLDGGKVSQGGIFQNTYPVKFELVSSLNEDRVVHVTLSALESFSMGDDGAVNFDAGTYTVQGGKRVTATVNMPTSDTSLSFENPLFPPNVALALLLDGKTNDSIRFER